MPFYSRLNRKNQDPHSVKKIRTARGIKNLKAALAQHFKDSTTQTSAKASVKIATWNLRDFGKAKNRDFECIYYIAEIISHFDIVALQEIHLSPGKLDDDFAMLMKTLGPEWNYVSTDVTDGDAGNGERMVFLYNRNKVFFKNIVGELTLEEGGKIRAHFGERLKLENGLELQLPNGEDLSGVYEANSTLIKDENRKLSEHLEIELPEDTFLKLPKGSFLSIVKNSKVTYSSKGHVQVKVPKPTITGEDFRLRLYDGAFDDSLRQFARTPFMISFQTGWLKINLCTVHIYYGDAKNPKILQQRKREIELLTEALANKAKTEYKYDKEAFMGVLGDFNIIGKDHPTMAALESNDFVVPEELKHIPGSNVEQNMTYDQIAFWKPSRITDYAKLDIMGANVFDFYEHVYTEAEATLYANEPDNGLSSEAGFKKWRTYIMSDHLPMWIELRSDFGEEYLDKVLK